MADRASSQPGPYLAGTTRHLPAGRDYEYFCDAVADLYVGIRPEVPDGRFDADFALYRLGDAHLGYLSTPGIPAARGAQSLRSPTTPCSSTSAGPTGRSTTWGRRGRCRAASPS